MRNLVSNAIKFSNENSTIKIEIDVISIDSLETIVDKVNYSSKIAFKKKEKYYVRLMVIDHGAGISKV